MYNKRLHIDLCYLPPNTSEHTPS